MATASLTLEPADEESLAYVETLLSESGLPSDDVRSTPEAFYVGYDGDERVGVGGIERRGTDGLLRSVVVEPAERGAGYGTALCDALEAEAASAGIEALYLLTTTASGFFADRGYVEISRSDAPAGIRRTTEFDELCPSTATCMRTEL